MVLFALCFLLFINAMSIGLVFPIFALLFFQPNSPLFAPHTDIYFKTFTYTFILALPNICMIFGAPFLGRLSDHYGRKVVLILGLVGVALSFFLSSAAILWNTLLFLFLSRALAGFMDGSEGVAQAAIADISHEKEKAKHMGYATFAGTIGFIIGPVLGGFLAEPSITGSHHFEIPFIASSILTLLNALILFFYLPKDAPTHDYPKKLSYASILGKGFKIAFDRRIRIYSLILFILQSSLAIFAQVTTIFLSQEIHYTSAEVGFFMTFLGACFSAGIFFVIHVLLHRIHHLRLLQSGILLTIVALIIGISIPSSEWFPWISVVPLMLGIAMMYNVLLSFISNAVSEKEQGDAMGSGTALKALGWLLSSFIVSSLYPNIRALFILLLIAAIVAFISSLNKNDQP